MISMAGAGSYDGWAIEFYRQYGDFDDYAGFDVKAISTTSVVSSTFWFQILGRNQHADNRGFGPVVRRTRRHRP